MPPHIEQMQEAIRDQELPHIYFNGFTVSLGNSDTTILLKLHDQPLMLLSLSHTLMKTIVEKLGPLIAEFENDMGQRIMTTDQIGDIIKSRSKDEENELG